MATGGITTGQSWTLAADGGDAGAERDADEATGARRAGGLGEELAADVGLGRAECSAQADLGASFDDGDDHHVGDADAADEQRDPAESEEQRRERGARRRPGRRARRTVATPRPPRVLAG